jgi:PAS domain-containing protein
MGATPDLDLIPAGVVCCDAMGRMTYLNGQMLAWLSVDTAEGHLGRPFYSLLSPAGRIYFETHLRPMLMIEGACSEISLELVAPCGDRHRIYLSGRVEKGDDGQVQALHFVCFEGVDRHRYEQELLLRRRKAEAYEAMVAASPDAIINVDPDLRILTWNDAAEGTPVTVDTARKHKDGSPVPVEASIARIKDERGDFAGAVSILRDITERQRNERTIEVLNREVLHRSKNLLTVAGSMAAMTARHTAPEEFVSVFRQRLSSLGNNLTLLVERNWGTVGLEDLVSLQLTHLGPTVLARVEVTTGPVTPPTRQGFGSKLTGRMLEMALGGTVTAAFAPEGFCWRCDFTV